MQPQASGLGFFPHNTLVRHPTLACYLEGTFYNTGGERANAWPTSRVLNMARRQGFFFSCPLITKYIQDAPSSGLFEDPQAKGNACFFNSSVHPTHPHPQPNHIPGSQRQSYKTFCNSSSGQWREGQEEGSWLLCFLGSGSHHD